jgi:hypothetical protein
MYLREGEVRQLLQRLTDRFDCDELLFDTLSPLAPWLSKVFTKGIVKWGIGNARDMETWNPKLRFLEQTPATAHCEKIGTTAERLIYRLLAVMPFGAYDTLNRFKY